MICKWTSWKLSLNEFRFLLWSLLCFLVSSFSKVSLASNLVKLCYLELAQVFECFFFPFSFVSLINMFFVCLISPYWMLIMLAYGCLLLDSK